jgi:O-glycosyl hydrolase
LTIQPVQTGPTVTANGTIDLTTKYQTIVGFGGAEAFYGSYLDQHPNRAQIYTALFDPTKGLGLTFLRVQNSYYNYNGSNASSFDTDTPAIIQAANQTAGTPLQILMSSWTPPAAIKSNNDINNGGTLNTVNGGYNYAGFAQFWHDSLAAYAALGVTPNLISIQNEPDFTASYVSCRFNPTEAAFSGQSYAGYDKAFDAVYQAIQTLPNPPKMIGPESFSTTNALAYATALEGETPQSSEVYALAHHLYNVSSSDPNPDDGSTALQSLASQFPQPLKFETEYYDAPGFNTAWNINNAFTLANDNSYFYWGLAWPSTIANGQASDQAGLLYIDNPFASTTTWAFPQGWSYNDAYYAFKHFSFYVRPGYVRYGAGIDNANERISAYESPDQKTLVVVVLNVSASATDTFALSSGSFSYTKSTVIRSTFSTPIATGERWNNLGGLPSAGLSLPPQSVATIILQQ